jgi:hypothetical protein
LIICHVAQEYVGGVKTILHPQQLLPLSVSRCHPFAGAALA